MKNYPLALSSWGEEELQAINRVIESDMYSMGPEVAEFETRFADFTGSKYCTMVNSGSSANLLAIAALFYKSSKPLMPGDEVIVPAVSWSTTYYPLSQYGLKLKFVDIDSETLNYDLNSLKEAVTDKTKLIVAVNLLGNPNEFKQIQSIISDKDIYLFEDNCESLGATYEGRQAGTFGIMGSFSTFFSHHMSTMEGGCIITEDEELYHILLCLRSHGWTRHLPEKNHVTGTKSKNKFEESYKFVLPGYNVRPVEMSGAIGIEQLKKLPSFLNARRSNADFFMEKISKFRYLQPQKEIGASSWFGFSLLVKEGAPLNRHDLIEKLDSNGIDTRPIVAGNFSRNPVMERMDYQVHGDLTNADLIHDTGFFIGNHHIDTSDSLNYLFDVLDELIQ